MSPYCTSQALFWLWGYNSECNNISAFVKLTFGSRGGREGRGRQSMGKQIYMSDGEKCLGEEAG